MAAADTAVAVMAVAVTTAAAVTAAGTGTTHHTTLITQDGAGAGHHAFANQCRYACVGHRALPLIQVTTT